MRNKEYDHVEKPDLPYRYEFGPAELDAVYACVGAHGFAVIKGLLPPLMVDELKESVLQVVDKEGDLGPGESRTHFSFVEESPPAWKLFDYKPFMALQRRFNGGDEMTLNRSAAIIRNPGSKPVSWHSDWGGFSGGPPKNSGDVLNRGPWPSGPWFYLTGSYPEHGGLAVIADSHTMEWDGPPGFVLSENRSTFYPQGGEPENYTGVENYTGIVTDWSG